MITERELNIEEAYNRLTGLHRQLGLHARIHHSKKRYWSPPAIYTTDPLKRFPVVPARENTVS